jgi:GT2 family glycosyltransferase
VWVVVPVHNRIDYTLPFLASVQDQDYPYTMTVLVDDGSTDDTAKTVASMFPECVVLPGDGSLWWAGATNLALDWVLERAADGDCVLTMNNDTVIEPDFVRKMVDAWGEWPRSLVGAVVADMGDRSVVDDAGVCIDWPTAKYVSPTFDERDMAEVNVLSGRGMLVPVGAFRECGLFDARALPQYGADYEFSARCARHGFELLVTRQAVVYSALRETGTSTRYHLLSWPEFVGSFFSRRSANNLLYRWRFVQRACPAHWVVSCILWDTARVVGGGLRDMIRRRSWPGGSSTRGGDHDV